MIRNLIFSALGAGWSYLCAIAFVLDKPTIMVGLTLTLVGACWYARTEML